MTAKTRLLLALPCLAALVVATGSAHASSLASGTAYCNIASNTGGPGTGYAIQTPTLAQLPNAIATSGGECATFTASALQFATNAGTGTDTLGGFLNSFGSATSISYVGTGSAASNFDGTLLVITGQNYLTNGETITLSHDDGVNVYLNGVAWILSGDQTEAGQPSFIYTGATGMYDYTLIFNSNYLAPAVLETNIGTTPEPSTLLMLGTGLVGLGGAIRRKMGV